ncbi:hypothetical protein SIID45300_01543 [Candidatus Magnetaquicoccaceae bacterium FCR-1]|uniref:Uncharacterized protein n=1 Tax=Candidatus Magnetaquiglobus chichijimensis TaxID=3141448 RepID=A0ABQ0C8K8_9PROT
MTHPLQSITLLVTRAHFDPPTPDDWQNLPNSRLTPPWRLKLFFLHQAVHLVDRPLWNAWLEAGHEASFCAHDHQTLHGPPPLPGIQPAGLATLGRWIRESSLTLSIPKLTWPRQPGTPGLKKIAILLNDHKTDHRQSLRLAAGLAGCDHPITLFHATPSPTIPPDATPYHQALLALGAQFRPLSSSDNIQSNHAIILTL